MNNDPATRGQGMPVTIVRPSGLGQDFVVNVVGTLLRVWVIRRALRRFVPDNDLSFRDVWVGLAALRAVQVGSDYAFWTREPLTWQKDVQKALRALRKGVKG